MSVSGHLCAPFGLMLERSCFGLLGRVELGNLRVDAGDARALRGGEATVRELRRVARRIARPGIARPRIARRATKCFHITRTRSSFAARSSSRFARTVARAFASSAVRKIGSSDVTIDVRRSSGGGGCGSGCSSRDSRRERSSPFASADSRDESSRLLRRRREVADGPGGRPGAGAPSAWLRSVEILARTRQCSPAFGGRAAPLSAVAAMLFRRSCATGFAPVFGAGAAPNAPASSVAMSR